MFRAEIYPLSDGVVLKMEGKLIDGCAEQAKCLINETAVLTLHQALTLPPN
jgi:hypothetical protein